MTAIRRRRVLALVLIPILLLPLTGCGGGSSGSDGQIPTESVTGVVNRTEVGGDSLSVQSAWAEPCGVEAEGEFSTVVSQRGAQLLLATDDAGGTRALCISFPQSVGAGESDAGLLFDADSTAAAIVFATPGIMSSDPAEGQARLAEIRSFSSFDRLLQFLQTFLPTTSLEDLQAGAELDALVCDVVQEWISKHPIVSAAAIGVSRANGDVVIEVVDQSNPARTKIKLSNWGWRCITVRRRDLTVEGNTLNVTTCWDDLCDAIGGAVPVSWGSLFMRDIGDPTVKDQTVNLTTSGVAKGEYWLLGPGYGPGGYALPADVSADATEAWGLSLTYYGLMPLIDLCIGGLLGYDVEQAVDLWSAVKGSIDMTAVLYPGSSTSAKARAIINLIFLIGKKVVTGGVLESLLAQKLGTAAAASATAMLAAIFYGAQLVFGSANVYMIVDTWVRVPRVAMISVFAYGNGGGGGGNGNGGGGPGGLVPGPEFLIAGGEDAQMYPSVCGQIVVWKTQQYELNWRRNIWFYDLATGQSAAVLAASNAPPDVSGRWVVADQYAGTWGIYGGILAYDLLSSWEVQLKPWPATQFRPRVDGDICVWADKRNFASTGWDIYARNLATGEEWAVCTAPGDQIWPDISGDTVVWLEQDGRGEVGQLAFYARTLRGGTEFCVCSGPEVGDFPRLSGRRLVWTRSQSVYYCGLDGGTPAVICDTALGTADVDGSIVVWADSRRDEGSFDGDIYAYDLATGEEYLVCAAPGLQWYPSISGDLIVWMDQRSGQYDIYGCYLYE